ncbi:hypothetical protein SRABI83_03141 [Arthrobacter sp. Bi83]|jgi:hypothetical protein|uniref:hypothetical protein n=1 Tax=Arthrobacter sp. Bi83 TaxID=2822353 RepID=UPI001D56D967|nr:hypothetical protein [Arthrobacter sp. Bi83]CAH0251828.1 hypothetical protein SRABI83_03141 [Arthrobacter sp. Bi83]
MHGDPMPGSMWSRENLGPLRNAVRGVLLLEEVCRQQASIRFAPAPGVKVPELFGIAGFCMA